MIVNYLNKSSDYPMMGNCLYNVIAIQQKLIGTVYCFVLIYTDGTKTNIGKVEDITFTEILKEV